MRVFNIVLIALNQGSQALVMGGMALFLPMIRSDIGITYAQAGALSAVATLTYALTQIPAGYVADRIRPKTQFLIGLLGIVTFSFTFSVLDNFSLLMVSQALLGLFRSFIFAPGMMLMIHQFPQTRRATAMGFYIAGGMSSNLMVSLFGPLLERMYGWRGVFWVLAGFALSMVLVQYLIGDPGPPRQPRERQEHGEVATVMRSSVLWLCCWIQLVRFAVASSVTLWLPSVLMGDKGFGLSAVSFAVGMGAVVTGISNVFGGLISDILKRPATVVTVSVAVLAVVIVLLTAAHSFLLVMGLVVVQAAFVQVYFGPLFEIPVLFLGAGSAGLASGVANAFANAGALVSSLALGWMRDVTGSFTSALQILALLCVTSALAGAVLVRADAARRAEPESLVEIEAPAGT